MKRFDEKWTYAEAAQELFFRSLSEHSTALSEKRLIELINGAFHGMSLRSSALPVIHQEAVLKAVREVKATLPKLTSGTKLHSVLWLRWALRSSSLPISNSFWLRLAQWRTNEKPSYVRLMQYRDQKTTTWRGKAHAIRGIGKAVGYTIDQVLARKAFAFDEYQVEWRIKSMSLEASRTESQQPRAIERICGQGAMLLLSKCIEREVAIGSPRLLSNALIGGKYKCAVPPAELLKELKNTYPELNRYSDNTLRRGLPAFVQCPRGRPGGIRPPDVSNAN